MNVNQDLIKQLRLDNGWTQQQLAEVSDLSLRTVQRIEKLGVASLESVNALCSVLGVDRDKLMAKLDSESLTYAKLKLPIRQKLTYLLIYGAGVMSGGLFVTFIF